MATTLVAGRVSAETKERADVFIRRAGSTNSDVIRAVWEDIATTGVVPGSAQRDASEGNHLVERLVRLRAATPRSAYLEGLTPEGLKEELANRD